MAEQWEVIEGAHSGMRGEFSIWPKDAGGNGDKRIACWIRTRETADLLCAAPELLAACEAMRNWLGEPDEVGGYDKKVWDQLDAAISRAKKG